MRKLVFAAGLALTLLLSGCGHDFSQYLPDQLKSDAQPQTLEAAVAAAQERTDRFSSGDLAGAWLLSSQQFRDGMSQSAYVTWMQTCKNQGLPITVVGVRMENGNAIVREEALGFKFAATMVYQDGQWLRAPDEDVVANFGKTGSEIIASEKAAGRCLKDASSDTPTSNAPTKTTTTTTTTAGAGQCSVNIPGCEGYAECHPVVTGNRDCFPEDESCAKPGNDSPWCNPSTTSEPPPKLNKAALADEVSHQLSVEVGRAPDAVNCPYDLTGIVGNSVRCSLADSGEIYGVTVTVAAVQGTDINFDIKVDNSPSKAGG